jgi:hypothetical protein
MPFTFRNSSLLACCIAAVCALGAPVVHAQSSKDATTTIEARARFNRGVELYRDGDLPGALAEFRRADALAPAYRLKYNIAQVCQEQHDYACALNALRAYLNGGGSDIPKAKRAEVQVEVTKLSAFVAELSISVDTPGAEILLDDASCGVAPLSAPLQVNAGSHRVSARQGALVATRSIEVAGGERREIALLLAPLPVAVPASQGPIEPKNGPDSAHSRPLAWAAGIGAGVFLAGAVVTGILALHESSELASERNQYPASADRLRSGRDSVAHLALASDVLGLLAIGAGAGAVYFAVRPVGAVSEPAGAFTLRGRF